MFSLNVFSSPFGQQTTGDTSGSGNSLLFSGLGGQPSAEKANTNVFGSTQTFSADPASSTGMLDHIESLITILLSWNYIPTMFYLCTTSVSS